MILNTVKRVRKTFSSTHGNAQAPCLMSNRRFIQFNAWLIKIPMKNPAKIIIDMGDNLL